MTQRTGINVRISWPVDKPIAELLKLADEAGSLDIALAVERIGSGMAGQQIVYVPQHLIDEYLADPKRAVRENEQIERGFITSMNPGGVFCRFFYPNVYKLRTTANSERAPFENVFPFEYTFSSVVNVAWEEVKKLW